MVLKPTLRAFEKAVANLQAFDPYIDPTQLTPVARYIVDAPTLRAIHMINADPQRTMSFTMFAQPDYFFETFSPCPGTSQGCANDGFAWIHGDYSNDIGQSWLGLVGPGVNRAGVDHETWTDHTDIVPTMMHLLGLATDYQPDGRVITQVLTPSVAKHGNSATFTELGDMYKQLNAPYGEFAHSLIVASTRAIKSRDDRYLETERAIQWLTTRRYALAQEMKNVLDGSGNSSSPQLVREGRELLLAAEVLARL